MCSVLTESTEYCIAVTDANKCSPGMKKLVCAAHQGLGSRVNGAVFGKKARYQAIVEPCLRLHGHIDGEFCVFCTKISL